MTEPNGSSISYTYDDHGNRTSMTYPDGKKAKYTYDSMNRLVSVKGTDGKKTTYTYDLLGQRISTDGEKEDTAYTYDEVGNLISQVTTGKYDVSLAYTYDLSGRMISESRTENGAAVESSYIYDALGQLTEFTRSDGIAESYTYDPAGNMLSKTAGGIKTNYTYNAANQLVGDGTYNYTYDKIGNLVEKAGNGGQVSYTYNALNLLEKWTDGENTESYTYNAAGLLSTVNTNTSTTSLTWDILYGDGVVISANENGTVTDYTYGLERISASTKNSRTEYVYDGRGSVIGEVTKSGFLSSAKVTTKSYTPFGEQIGEKTSGFGWNGEYYSATTGQVYLRARFYEPEMNRFSQKDMQYFVTNEYIYCFNDPMNYVDINGREAIVISGGDYNDKGETETEGLNSYNFITTALREIESIKEAGIDDNVTWIVANAGWDDSDTKMFEEAALKENVKIIYINSADELTTYINTQKNPSFSGNREDDPISYMSLYSHGISTLKSEANVLFQNGDFDSIGRVFNELKAGNYSYIDLGYNYTDSHNPDLILRKDDILQWSKDSFSTKTDNPSVEACIKLYSCYTANGGKDSLAYAMAETTGLTTYGYTWQSSFGDIMSTPIRRTSEKFLNIVDTVASERWAALEARNVPPSVNPPKAGTRSATKQMQPNNTIKTIDTIPDLAEFNAWNRLKQNIVSGVQKIIDTVVGWIK